MKPPLFRAIDKSGNSYTYAFIDTFYSEGYECNRLYCLWNFNMNGETLVEKEWFRQRKIRKFD